MSWIQLHFQTNKDHVDLIEGLLYLHGVLSIELTDAADQPILEPALGTTPLWDDVVVSGLFSADTLSGTQAEKIQAHISTTAQVSNLWLTNLADKAWERAWMDHYEPIQCTDNLWVIPKWLDAPDPTAVNVLMDPGLAFGTGYHASTRLCLQWLATQDLTDKLVIDYGCGSGILAVAALKMGARYAYCVDIDPQAVTATKENASINKVQENLWAGLPHEFAEKNIVDAEIMIANILAKPLMSLAETFGGFTQANAKIVLAGLIDEQTDIIREAYAPWFKLPDKAHAEENWIRLAGHRL